MFIFLALLFSLLLITNYNAITRLGQARQRLERLESEHEELERRIKIREAELDMLRRLLEDAIPGGNR
jgi:C4-dicarboxylate-specific signal transduction histidine kinase